MWGHHNFTWALLLRSATVKITIVSRSDYKNQRMPYFFFSSATKVVLSKDGSLASGIFSSGAPRTKAVIVFESFSVFACVPVCVIMRTLAQYSGSWSGNGWEKDLLAYINQPGKWPSVKGRANDSRLSLTSLPWVIGRCCLQLLLQRHWRQTN